MNDSAGKEQEHPEDKHECLKSENERHGKIMLNDQDDDIGCI
jgi:hypothetical protein